MTRLRTEAQAWREIARRIDAQDKGTLAFLCWHLSPDYQSASGVIAVSAPMRRRMLARLTGHLRHGSLMDGGTSGEERRQFRVTAALFLALEAINESHATNS